MSRARRRASHDAIVVTEATARAVQEALLPHYDARKRDLPWRRTRDPYAVWVSEMMLQQTQVATVVGYYERWMDRFPTALSLADAAEADVLHAWQGLGYYSRARNLRRGAIAVRDLHGGRIPRSVEDLRRLPGVGPYTAGAIASIAHGERTPLVDGNVVRVLCRLFGLRGNPTRSPLRSQLWRTAEALVPEARPGDFNQALMELGATVCTPRRPRCEVCPLRARCEARRADVVAELPELPKRAPPLLVERAAAIVHHGGRFLCVQVPQGAPRWAGMWQFPNAEVDAGDTAEGAARREAERALGARLEPGRLSLTVRHSVVHHRVTLDVFRYEHHGRRSVTAPLGPLFKTAPELDELALPAAHRRIARWIQERAFVSSQERPRSTNRPTRRTR